MQYNKEKEKEKEKFRSFENANLLYKVINLYVSCVVLKEGKVHFKALKESKWEINPDFQIL